MWLDFPISEVEWCCSWSGKISYSKQKPVLLLLTGKVFQLYWFGNTLLNKVVLLVFSGWHSPLHRLVGLQGTVGIGDINVLHVQMHFTNSPLKLWKNLCGCWSGPEYLRPTKTPAEPSVSVWTCTTTQKMENVYFGFISVSLVSP